MVGSSKGRTSSRHQRLAQRNIHDREDDVVDKEEMEKMMITMISDFFVEEGGGGEKMIKEAIKKAIEDVRKDMGDVGLQPATANGRGFGKETIREGWIWFQAGVAAGHANVGEKDSGVSV